MPTKSKSPPVEVFLSAEMFNVLIEFLTKFIDTEKIIGKTELNTGATALKNKIMRYARPFTDKEENKNAAVYFFENEATMLIELMVFSLGISEKSSTNYYEILENSKQK